MLKNATCTSDWKQRRASPAVGTPANAQAIGESYPACRCDTVA